MNLLYDKLTALGFEVERPGGTFYIFPKALEAVSYTHLDVYKRQRQGRGRRRGSCCSSHPEVPDRERLIPQLT